MEVSVMKEEVKRINELYQKEIQKYEDIKSKYSLVELTTQKHQVELAGIEEIKRAKEERIYELKQSLEVVTAERQKAIEDKKRTEILMEELQYEHKTMKNNLETLQAAYDKNDKIRHKLQLELDDKTDKLDALQEKFDEMKKEYTEIRTKHKELQLTSESNTDKHTASEREYFDKVEYMKEKIRDLQKDLTAESEAVDIVQKKLDATKKAKDQLQSDNLHKNNKIDLQRVKIEEQETKIGTMKKEIKAANIKITLLTDTNTQNMVEIESLRRGLKTSRTIVDSTQETLVKTEMTKMEQFSELAQDHYLQASQNQMIIEDHASNITRLADLLNSTSSELTFTKARLAKLENLANIHDEEMAKLLKKITAQTNEIELLSTNLLDTQTQLSRSQDLVLSHETELRIKEKQNEALQREVDELNRTLYKSKNDLSRQKISYDSVLKTKNQLTKSLKVQKDETKRMKNLNAQAKLEVEQLHQDIQKIKDALKAEKEKECLLCIKRREEGCLE